RGEAIAPGVAGVAAAGADRLRRPPKPLGGVLANGAGGAADVDRADGERDRAVDMHVQRHRGLAAEIEPEAGGHAATLVAAERSRVVRVPLGRLEAVDEADAVVLRAVRGFRALLGRVLQA